MKNYFNYIVLYKTDICDNDKYFEWLVNGKQYLLVSLSHFSDRIFVFDDIPLVDFSKVKSNALFYKLPMNFYYDTNVKISQTANINCSFVCTYYINEDSIYFPLKPIFKIINNKEIIYYEDKDIISFYRSLYSKL